MIYWLKIFLREILGITGKCLNDPRKVIILPKEVFCFFKDLIQFVKYNNGTPIKIMPVLFQRNSGSPFDSHYVYQAYWATSRIIVNTAETHVDVSSNIPFVAQLSANIPVSFFEFNPPALNTGKIKLENASLECLPIEDKSVFSLSCLHVIEHIGLGRYGDPIDPEGSKNACLELQRVLARGGNLYVSVPVGKRQICFNAHRIFAPEDVIQMFPELTLREFSVVDDKGELLEKKVPEDFRQMNYACGLYHFVRD
jgi:hypothetical protein